MSTLNITLPEPLTAFIDAQVAAGKYRDASEYIQSLICKAHEAQEHRAMEAKILAGIESLERGEGREMTAEDWQRLRQEYGQRHKASTGP